MYIFKSIDVCHNNPAQARSVMQRLRERIREKGGLQGIVRLLRVSDEEDSGHISTFAFVRVRLFYKKKPSP